MLLNIDVFVTNKWSFPVSEKPLASCHTMGLVRVQKQWLVFHTCTRLGYQHKHQLTILQPFLRSCWSVLQPVSIFSVSQDWGHSTKPSWTSSLPTEMQMKIIFSSASQNTGSMLIPFLFCWGHKLSGPMDRAGVGHGATRSWESRGSIALSPEMAVDTGSSRGDNKLLGKGESKLEENCRKGGSGSSCLLCSLRCYWQLPGMLSSLTRDNAEVTRISIKW